MAMVSPALNDPESTAGRCLICEYVLVNDGELTCDLHPDGIPLAILAGKEGCEEMDVEGNDLDDESIW